MKMKGDILTTTFLYDCMFTNLHWSFRLFSNSLILTMMQI